MFKRYAVLFALTAVVFSFSALAENVSLSRDEIIARIAAADSKIESCESVRIERSEESECAWVFCEGEMNGSRHTGSMWFVTPTDCMKLGEGKHIVSFELLTDANPDICVCNYLENGNATVHAAFADDAGHCEMWKGCEDLTSLSTIQGVLIGTTRWDDEIVPLATDMTNGCLREIIPLKVTQKEIDMSKYTDDFTDVKEQLEDQFAEAVQIDSYFYYSSGVMAVNFKVGSSDMFVYVFKTASGAWMRHDSWDNGIMVSDGYVSGSRRTQLKTFKTEHFDESDLPFFR